MKIKYNDENLNKFIKKSENKQNMVHCFIHHFNLQRKSLENYAFLIFLVLLKNLFEFSSLFWIFA